MDSEDMKEAKKAYSSKKYDTALKLFQKVADQNPSEGEPYLYMGYIYENRKEFPKSISMFRKAVEGNLSKSQKSTSLLKLALYYDYYKEYDQAYVYSARYLKLNPGNSTVEKIFDRAEQNRGKSPGRISNPNPQPVPTTSSSVEATNQKKTKADWEAAIRKDPNDEEARWELSLIAFNEKDFAKAESLMKPLVENYPTKPSYSYKLGVTQLRLDKYSESLGNFALSKKHVPSDDKTFLYYLYLNEGIAFYKLEKFLDSESSLMAAQKLSTKTAPSVALVRVYFDSNQNDKCVQVSEKIWKDLPDPWETRMFGALCKLDRDKDMNLLFSWEKDLRNKFKTAESIPDSLYPGLIKLAREYTNQEKYAQAEEYYKVLEKSLAKDREFLFYRGKGFFYTQNYKRAIELLSQVERSSAAFYLLSKSYANLKDRGRAEQYLKQAGDMKAIYWDLAREESDFAEFRKTEEFLQFLDTKGGKLAP